MAPDPLTSHAEWLDYQADKLEKRVAELRKQAAESRERSSKETYQEGDENVKARTARSIQYMYALRYRQGVKKDLAMAQNWIDLIQKGYRKELANDLADGAFARGEFDPGEWGLESLDEKQFYAADGPLYKILRQREELKREQVKQPEEAQVKEGGPAAAAAVHEGEVKSGVEPVANPSVTVGQDGNVQRTLNPIGPDVNQNSPSPVRRHPADSMFMTLNAFGRFRG